MPGSPSRGLPRLAARATQLLGEPLQLHELQEALLDRELEVLEEERPIDVLLVSLDDGIGLEGRIHVEGHDPGLLRNNLSHHRLAPASLTTPEVFQPPRSGLAADVRTEVASASQDGAARRRGNWRTAGLRDRRAAVA